MAWFSIEFIDGKEISVEADVYEERDGEWIFGNGNEIKAHYKSHEIRGIKKLPGRVRTTGGGSY